MNSFKEYVRTHPLLTNSDLLRRMSRHLTLMGWGIEQQLLLDSNRILIVGAGGLGSAVALAVCSSTFKNKGITIVDPDRVELTNLHRQLAYTEADIGLFKTDRLSDLCSRRNSDCNVSAVRDSFNEVNAFKLFTEHDIIFDCTDNVAARILISDTWVKTGRSKTLISGSCVSWSGQIVTLVPGSNGCLRCVYGEEFPVACDRLGQCSLQGVMGPVVTLMGNHQVMDLIHLIKNPQLATDILRVRLFDFSKGSVSRELEIPPNCSLCTGNTRLSQVKEEELIRHGANLFEIAGDEFLKLIGSGCSVLDVRERKHYECSHITGSVNLPASLYLHAGSDSLDIGSIDDLTDPIVVVCRRGIDSLKFVSKLERMFPWRKIFSLKEGLTGIGIGIV
jgi:molybdopterin/thiamine biosynthesis adenylyltransferase/rhodanese-related sulfurtransferase